MLESRTGGVIESYDPETRLVRVSIPGITDGSELLPEAELEYPMGDDSRRTEIEIIVGAQVWLAFQNGDPRYPIITGYRNPRVGNDVGTRRFRHKNIELEAYEVVNVICKNAVVTASESIDMTTQAMSISTNTLAIVAPGGVTVDAPLLSNTGDIQDRSASPPPRLQTLDALRQDHIDHTHDVPNVQAGSTTRTSNPPTIP